MSEATLDIETSSQAEEQIVVFRLESESYGINIFRVHEIIRVREITPIPQTEAHIKGLVNLRGKTIPVVDLRARFFLSTADETQASRIIVVEGDHGNVGMIVDEVAEVLTLSADEIEKTPSLVSNLSTDFVRGVAKRGDRLITLLDLDKALAA